MNTIALKRYSLALLGVLTAQYIFLYFYDPVLYREMIREDSVTEWATAVFLIFSSVLSGLLVIKIRTKHRYWHWFFIVFCFFSLLAALEEISWGQRIFGIESGEFFEKYNDQQETNLHNTFQGVSGIKTKHIALILMFLYGVILPLVLEKSQGLATWFSKKRIIVPPKALIAAFLVATVLMLDFQTGHEEEIGELYFSIAFVLLMMWNLSLLRKNYFKVQDHTPSSGDRL